MGNCACCERCFGRLGDKRKYLRTRYNIERNFSIEFENLMEEDVAQQENISKGQLQLSGAGPFNVSAYMKWLVNQEEELRQEEEAMYEAKREAARVAKMQNHKHQKAIMGATRANNFNWFEDESEQGLGTGNEDFEMFLDNVKQRSLAARTRAIASQVPGVDGESGSSMAAPSDRTDAESSIDLDWEHEPGMTPVPRTKQQILDDFTQLALGPAMLQANVHQNPGFEDLEWDHDYENEERKTLLGKEYQEGEDGHS